MENNIESYKVTLQRLKDAGYAPMIVGRIGRLIEAFNGNVNQFTAATKAQLEATYAKVNPNEKGKGLGSSTFKAFDEFARLRKAASYDARQAAEEAVKIREEKEAMASDARTEALSESIDLAVMTDVVAWYSAAFAECTLDDLVKAYHKFVNKKQKGN